MIPTAAEPIMFHSGPVDGVCPQDYPNAYGHSINSFCFDLEAENSKNNEEYYQPYIDQ